MSLATRSDTSSRGDGPLQSLSQYLLAAAATSFLTLPTISLAGGPPPAIPVTITADGTLDGAIIDVVFNVDLFDPDSGNSESFSFRSSAFQGGPTQTPSPAFNALLNANPGIRASVAYDANSRPPNSSIQNQFAAVVTTRLRDPSNGEFALSRANNGRIALFNGGTNLIGPRDELFAFGTPNEGLLGFSEFFDVPSIEAGSDVAAGGFGFADFTIDFYESFDDSNGNPIEQVLGQTLTDEIAGLLTFDGTLDGILPDFYSANINTIQLVDRQGQVISSANDMFSLPIADLDEIDDGSLSISFFGNGEFFNEGDFGDGNLLSDGREVTVNVDFVEAYAFYNFNSAIATTTPQSVLDEYNTSGDLPIESIPGAFSLPDVVDNPPDSEPISVNGEEFNPGATSFFNDISLEERITYDPEIAIGYEYELTGVDAGEGFADIMLPVLGNSEYMIAVFDPTTGEYLDAVPLSSMTAFDLTDFGFAVTRFSILGIDPAAMLDPADDRAFPALIGFVGSGSGSLRQTALVVDTATIPEPSTWLLLASGIALLAARRRR